MTDPRKDTAWLCEQLPALRRLAAKKGTVQTQQQLEAIVETARQGGGFKEPLISLALSLGVAVDDLMAYQTSFIPPTPPPRVRYVCPVRICAREWCPEPSKKIPSCEIGDQQLRAERELD
ncbi:hypothetical protein [Streptomyces cyanogenus]|uniref:Uncharacterized protein n=1 Tax=Streptomyces cyanogenus TaxID=80860 RepID=A0ABX7THA3_STRCY|nr:hypothetical protein [Streptomyces cyanogenus]QTD95785.1 hypothetical protein S1361_00435 [Streptomyces cyanogenus]QTE03205.1 hypothetical protein S1361_38065 [Streptomyces cyanogenus]